MKPPRPTLASALDLRARAAALLQAREVARRESERLAAARKRRLELKRVREVQEEAERRKRLRIWQGVPPLEASGLERLEVSRGVQEIQRPGRRQRRRARGAAKERPGQVSQLRHLHLRLLEVADRRARAQRVDQIRGRRAHYHARVGQRRAEALARRTGIRLEVAHVQASDPERLLEALLGLARVMCVPSRQLPTSPNGDRSVPLV